MRYIIYKNQIHAWNINSGKITPLTLYQACSQLNNYELLKDRLKAELEAIKINLKG